MICAAVSHYGRTDGSVALVMGLYYSPGLRACFAACWPDGRPITDIANVTPQWHLGTINIPAGGSTEPSEQTALPLLHETGGSAEMENEIKALRLRLNGKEKEILHAQVLNRDLSREAEQAKQKVIAVNNSKFALRDELNGIKSFFAKMQLPPPPTDPQVEQQSTTDLTV